MNQNNFKLIVAVSALILSLIAIAAIAGPMTWSKPLPSQADATLGYNMQVQKNADALTEIRTRVAAMGVFAGYTTQGN